MPVIKKTLRVTLWLIAVFGLGSIALGCGIYLYLSPKLPNVEAIRDIQLQTPLRIYSADNQLIGEFGEKRRTPIDYSSIPQHYINAILAAEDDQFYSHNGVSVKGLMRAASQLLTSGQIKTGGSTITMQVARNFFLTRKQTFSRKFNEILLALQIERELSKQEILELYVNKIYLGNRAYGIQAASQVYYGTDIGELSLAQLAMIAGLPKAPSAFNPIINPSRALIRRNWILGRMLSLNLIDNELYQDAKSEPLSAKYHGSIVDLHAPYVAEMARKKALEILGNKAYTEGYSLYTTVNANHQATAQAAIQDGLITYDQRHGYRGPEAQLSLDLIESSNTNNDGIEPNYNPWQKEVAKLTSFGKLVAAAIIGVDDKKAIALLGSGEKITIEWDNGLSQARRYKSENARGPKPKTASDVVGIGDVIRTYQKDGSWIFSQTPKAQATLVALSPRNGAIRSLVGGLSFNQSKFNRAIQAKRQPGSNFKPFVYTSALENGFTPASIINDAPIVFDDASLESTWRPENASGKFFGPTRLRKALYKSRNLVSIRLLRSNGINNTLNTLERLGFDSETMPKDLSLALGSYGLTPLEVATGYAILANGGYRVTPYLVDSIYDSEQQLVYQATPDTVCNSCLQTQHANRELGSEASDNQEGATTALETQEFNIAPLPQAERVIDPQTAYIIDSMLKDVITKGTGRKALVLKRSDLAGKTGTTNGPKDAWFSGYSPDLVATTWLGFDANTELGKREYGGSAALPIWIDYMKVALAGVPEHLRSQPEGLTTVRIDPETGERADINDDNAIFEIFRSDQLPPEKSQQSNPLEAIDEALPDDIF